MNDQEVSDVTVENGGNLTLNLSTVSGVTISEDTSITVKVGGSEVTDAYNSSNKKITLTNVTGKVEITVTASNP